MDRISELLRRLAAEALEPSVEESESDTPPEEEKAPKGPVRYKYAPERVTAYFEAPDKPSTATVSDEGNFQWTRYELLFTRSEYTTGGKLEEGKHFIFRTPLYPWGVEAPGGQEVLSGEKFLTEKSVTPDEAKRNLIKYLAKPELYPAGLHGTYINIHKSAPGKKYPFAEFDRKFRKSGFYKVVSKEKELKNP